MDEKLKRFTFERYEGSEKTSRNKKKPCSRFDATDELVAVFKKDTPGESATEERFGLSLDLIEAVKRVVKGEKSAPKKGKPDSDEEPVAKGKSKPGAFNGKPDDEPAEEVPSKKTPGDEVSPQNDTTKFGSGQPSDGKKVDPTVLDKKLASQDRERDMDSDDETAAKIPSGKTPVVLNPEIDTSGQDDMSDQISPTKTVGGSPKGKRGSKKVRAESVFGTPENFGLSDDLIDTVRGITELSKGTLGSYVKRASDSRADAQADMESAEKSGNGKKLGKSYRKVINRRTGIHRAVDRLTSEETIAEKKRYVPGVVNVGSPEWTSMKKKKRLKFFKEHRSDD